MGRRDLLLIANSEGQPAALHSGDSGEDQSGSRQCRPFCSKKSPEDSLEDRCDSLVVETDAHFPTDANLLYGAIRKANETVAPLSATHGVIGWGQSGHLIRRFKSAYHHIQRLRHSTSQSELKRQAKQDELKLAIQDYLALAGGHLERIRLTQEALANLTQPPSMEALEDYLQHAERQIDQIRRRVLEGETIPHEEKVLSIFQPYTEWVQKGKAGVPVELGLKVCMLEDQHGFMLHHQMMEKTTDEQVAVAITQKAKERFQGLSSVSYDKGFHSPANQTEIKNHIDQVILPKKGRLSATDRERQSDPEFVRLRKRHSAMESAINALEAHGLDFCPDHGIKGFHRYVGLAVLARNIQRLGVILREKEPRARRGPYKKAA